MSSKTALVVGAGIAGPAVAIALSRAGIEAAVYEGSAAPRDDEGAFLNLVPNGLAVLNEKPCARGRDHASRSESRHTCHSHGFNFWR
jgi:2-polyprenyl-6-methoxyphenol hydroxylase-like FAD-dependent oxidoreductase